MTLQNLKRRHRRLAAGMAAITLVVCATTNLSADEGPASATSPLNDEWRGPLSRFVAFLDDLSSGRMEDAWQKYRIMLPMPPKMSNGPFEPDPFEQFSKKIGRFPPGLANLRVIGDRRFTPNSRKFTLVGDTDIGPVVTDVLIFRVRGEWFFGQVNYKAVTAGDADWLRGLDDLLPATRYDPPLDLPLPQRAETETTSR